MRILYLIVFSFLTLTSYSQGFNSLVKNVNASITDTVITKVNIDSVKIYGVSKNELGYDAWGRNKTYQDNSIFHGMFSYGVPVRVWKEKYNGVEQAFVNSTSVDGKLVVTSGNSFMDETILESFRNPRYQPNRGHLFSTSIMLPNIGDSGIRRWGIFTEENGVFFSLEVGQLYAIVRTTIQGVLQEDKYLIDTTGIDLSKGNVYDIQFQWRGVGNYKFFINLNEVKSISYLGTRVELSMSNPALPVSFQCDNLGQEVEMHVGCVDVTSEGGDNRGKTYGSVCLTNQTGEASFTGYNQPIIAVKSKNIVDLKRNTRDILSLSSSAYADEKCVFRIWVTRDSTSITQGNSSWQDYGDGHLEFIERTTTGGTLSFDVSKAELQYSCRVAKEQTYTTNMIFDGLSDIYITPGDIMIFTLHRETGGATKGGVTFEFGEEI